VTIGLASSGAYLGEEDGAAPSLTILAPPGRYTVKLRVGGVGRAQPLVVLKDPDSGGSAADVAAQTAMLVNLSADLTATSTLYGGIDNVRGQLRALSERLPRDAANADVRASTDSLEAKFTYLADSLAQQKPGAFYEWPQKLAAKLSYLASEVQTSDHRPTDQARDAHVFLRGQLRLVKTQYDALLQKDLPAFNALLRQKGLPPVIVVQP
jgi:hypothetical protein